MVLGEDGFKMSKSRGNIIVPEEILVKYGADALRQWAAMGAATGSDIMFRLERRGGGITFPDQDVEHSTVRYDPA